MKSKERSKIEYYKGTIRKLKAENAQLRKALNRFQNFEPEEEDFDLEVKEIKPKKCPSCYERKLRETKVAGRIITTCEECTYRKVEKV